MFKDVSHWVHAGPGGSGKLEKEELKSPDGLKYMIKYPRPSQGYIYWEDIIELVAAQIGRLLHLPMMDVEVVVRKGRRACLLRCFIEETKAQMHEEGGVLLDSLVIGYTELQESALKDEALLKAGFTFMDQFMYWPMIKEPFIEMLIFDILIGNQDRHPFNWSILFFDDGIKLSPLYDNGASLGFHFDDKRLEGMLSNYEKVKKYAEGTKVKCGLFEGKRIKAKTLLNYLKEHYFFDCLTIIKKLKEFNLYQFKQEIHSLRMLTDVQKEWIIRMILYRREMILEWFCMNEGGD